MIYLWKMLIFHNFLGTFTGVYPPKMDRLWCQTWLGKFAEISQTCKVDAPAMENPPWSPWFEIISKGFPMASPYPLHPNQFSVGNRFLWKVPPFHALVHENFRNQSCHHFGGTCRSWGRTQILYWYIVGYISDLYIPLCFYLNSRYWWLNHH